jgi:hypothetical protein
MPKKSSSPVVKDDLFALIKAMSPSEKRYFSVNNSRKRDNKGQEERSEYLDLYDLLSKMEEYDDTKLKQSFKARLADTKAYLYDAILRSIRQYRSKRLRYGQIKDKILDARYLNDLGLYDQAFASLDSATEMAESIDDNLSLLEINRERRKIMRMQLNQPMIEAMAENIADYPLVLQKIQLEALCLEKYDQIMGKMVLNAIVKSEEEQAQLAQDFHLLLHLDHEPKQPLARLRFFQGRFFYYFYLGDLENAYENSNIVLAIWAEQPLLQVEEKIMYINDMTNNLNVLCKFKRYEEASKKLATLKKIETHSFHEEYLLFRRFTHLDLYLRINQVELNQLDQLESSVMQGLKLYKIPAGTESSMLYSLTFLFYMAERYQVCIEYTDRILKRYQVQDRIDARFSASLIRILAMYDNDDEQIDNAFRSTLRLFQAQNADFDLSFEHEVVNFFQKLNKATERERKTLITDFLRQVIQNHPDTTKYRMEINEVMAHWCQAKLKSISFAEQVRRGGNPFENT